MDLLSFTLEITVGDLEASTEWYARLLGREHAEPDDGIIEFELSPTAYLMLSPREEGSTAEPGGSVNLQVPDLVTALAELDTLGIAHSDVEQYSPEIAVVTVHDPDGRDVSIVQIGG
ncbi:VOC family protein [Cellulomonas xiejunii]|uniref:VOC family protein n=1 Tax=Cellulomonas xiejunii TaxID=2968083 RepID=A0ABY5KS14_9CELL|nr:VOC family protein [Cellulomonas xiejunii]MCC2313822.1 VOC family protein [Cellulomonas xiejunii]MCC2322533.1 VOC family protein [Cellulomonas xiejunii]UUI72570.1 VOC family protein [Cellulomonas xiejunii]